MIKITKKEFKELHKTKQLSLINSCWGRSALSCINFIKSINTHFTGTPVTRCSIDNNGDYEVINVFKETIREQDFYFVESTIDNSKNKNCSWDTIDINTVVYVKHL